MSQILDIQPPARRGRPPKSHREDKIPPLPPVGNRAWGVPIYGKDLKVGDTVVHLHVDHETHVIDRFEPYKGGLALDAGARTAWAGTWDLAVGPYSVVRILRRGAEEFRAEQAPDTTGGA